jgi:PAS domain S-box-containing protein
MTKKRVLIVEDEAIIVMHLKNTLAGMGFEVAGAAQTARDAIAKCGEVRPDLILMDIVLPGGMDGIEASTVIQSSHDIPVVYITGNADMATVKRARETNPYGYVIKPINAQDLFSTIDTALHRRGLEMKLRESEARHRLVTDMMSDVIWTTDADLNITYVSPSVEKVIGFTVEERMSHKLGEMIPPDTLVLMKERFDEEMRLDGSGGADPDRTVTVEFEHIRKDGSVIMMENTVRAIRDGGGRIAGLHGVSRDVTSRNRAIEALKQSEEKFRALFDQSSAGVFIYDRDLVVLDCNQQFADIIKAPRDRIIGLNLNILKEKGIISAMRGVLDGKPNYYEGPYLSTLTGKLPWISATVSPLRGPGGDVIGGIGVVIDLTERKQTEEALKEQEANIRAIFEQTSVGIVLYSNEMKVTDCNKRFADMLGSMRESIIGFDITNLRDRSIIPFLSEALEGKLSYYEGPYHATTSDASRWVSSSISPIRGIDGSVKGGLLVVIDLTEKHESEKIQREREEMFHAVFDQSPAGIVIFSRDLIVIDCNRRYEEIMHSSREKIIGFDIKNLRDKTVTPNILEALSGKNSYYEGPYMATTSDARLWVSFNASPIRDINNEVTGAMVVVIDITKRWKAELALRESDERYRYIFDNANDFIFTLDLNGKYTSFNRQALDKTGYTYDEAINLTIIDVVAPEYRDLAVEMMKKKLDAGESTTYEVELQTKNGGRIPLEVITQLMIRDGRPVGIQGIGRDITERRQMEEQIRKSLREKETLLKEVHHRVKNNFQVILSLINLQSSSIENHDLQKYFADAQSRIRSMALVHELLYQSEDISRLDISTYITTIVNELFSSYHRTARMREPRIVAGRIDLTIDQAIPCGLIINELVTNALKYAFPPGWRGDPDIEITVTEKGGMVELAVGDNGVGLPESIDFNTTKTLGLSLVPVLARQLMGSAEVYRSGGTRIVVRFPKK